MGAYSPVPVVTDAVVERVLDTIIAPTLATLTAAGIDYRGLLYAGCMLTADGPKLIEYNIRFGDPESEAVLLRTGADLRDLLVAVAHGAALPSPTISRQAAVCVVMAARGYPGAVVLGDPIHGLARASTVEGVTVFHAGTRREDSGEIVTAGGRVLAVSAVGNDLTVARARAYAAVEEISFDGAQVRRDIAAHAAGLAAPTGGAR
jgi:phosphoribosylamine--glycine ligase